MLVKHARSGGKCLLEWVPKSSRAKPSWLLELEPGSRAALWLHNVPCERGWPSPISTGSSNWDHFLLLLPLAHFLQVASLIHLPLGKPWEPVHLIRKWLA